jgi:benzoylformate decarboxylase
MDVYRQRFGTKPDRPYLHMDLGQPKLGFLDLARGLGLSAERIETPGEMTGALSRAIAAKRPHLIEVVIEAKVVLTSVP